MSGMTRWRSVLEPNLMTFDLKTFDLMTPNMCTYPESNGDQKLRKLLLYPIKL